MEESDGPIDYYGATDYRRKFTVYCKVDSGAKVFCGYVMRAYKYSIGDVMSNGRPSKLHSVLTEKEYFIEKLKGEVNNGEWRRSCKGR